MGGETGEEGGDWGICWVRKIPNSVYIFISPFIVKIHRTNFFPALDIGWKKGRARF